MARGSEVIRWDIYLREIKAEVLSPTSSVLLFRSKHWSDSAWLVIYTLKHCSFLVIHDVWVWFSDIAVWKVSRWHHGHITVRSSRSFFFPPAAVQRSRSIVPLSQRVPVILSPWVAYTDLIAERKCQMPQETWKNPGTKFAKLLML